MYNSSDTRLPPVPTAERRHLAVAMSHRIEPATGLPRLATYQWIFRGKPCLLRVETTGHWLPLASGSNAEFITGHYRGYTKRRGGSASEHKVPHPPWRVMTVVNSSFVGDGAVLYGECFREFLTGTPDSALFAEGSPITVHQGRRLAP